MSMNRRELLAKAGKLLVLTGAASAAYDAMYAAPRDVPEAFRKAEHWWGMIIDIDKCIGCGNCVRACADENGVPDHYFRTWVERYQVSGFDSEHPHVDSPNGGKDGFPPRADSGSATSAAPLFHHKIRTPSCRNRAGRMVDVTRPNVGEPNDIFGVFSCGRLNRLNASPRNSMRPRSERR